MTSRLHERAVKVDVDINDLENVESLLREIIAHCTRDGLEIYFEPIDRYATLQRILEQLRDEINMVQSWNAKVDSFKIHLTQAEKELADHIVKITPMKAAFESGRLMPPTRSQSIPLGASAECAAAIRQEWENDKKRHADHIKCWEEEERLAKRQKITTESNTPSDP